MAISFDKALGLYESALKLRSEKAQLLSSNLANTDTPGYKARDIDFHAALESRLNSKPSASSLRVSREGHAGSMGSVTPMTEIQYRVPTQPSIDGNTVEEHVEHSEFMKNSLEFQTAFTLLNSRFKGLIGALKGE